MLTVALLFADAEDPPHFQAGRPFRTVESEINIQADKAEEGSRTCGKDFDFRIRAQSFELCKQPIPSRVTSYVTGQPDGPGGNG
jgi:hypothetical protein